MLVAKSGFVDGIRLGHSAVVTTTASYILSTNYAKFGSTSLYSNNVSALVKVTPFSDFAFGTGNFTIELWYRPINLAAEAVFIGFRPPSVNGNYIMMGITSTGAPYFYTASAYKIQAPVNTCIANNWYAIALVRYSGSTKLYVGGTQVGITYSDPTNYLAGSCTIGANDFLQSGFSLRGNLDELRVSNIARYTGNYTPATQPFIDDSNTLLLLHFDGANNGQTLVDDNT